MGLTSHPRREVHCRPVVVPIHSHGRAVMSARTGQQHRVAHDELSFEKLEQRADGTFRTVEPEHHRIADGLDELVARAQNLHGAVAERPHDEHRMVIAMRFSHRREPGQVHEGERRLSR